MTRALARVKAAMGRLTQCSLSPPTDSCNASIHPPSPTSRQGQRATPRGRIGSLIELEPGASVKIRRQVEGGRQDARHNVMALQHSAVGTAPSGGTFERHNG